MGKGVRSKEKVGVDTLATIQKALVFVMVLLSSSLVYNIGGDLKEVRSVGKKDMLTGEQLVDYQGSWEKDNYKEEEVSLVGRLKIPKIKVDNSVVIGTSKDKLKNSVGVLEGSDVPLGREGEMCIVIGHRGYIFRNRFFWGLDELEKGDAFTLEMFDGVREYEVVSKKTMDEQELGDLENKEDNSKLVLVTSPKFGDKGIRVVVEAKLNK